MRVVALHSGASISSKLRFDSYHVHLFETQLQLVFQKNKYLYVPSKEKEKSSIQVIEELPRGKIVGLILLMDGYLYKHDQHSKDPWVMYLCVSLQRKNKNKNKNKKPTKKKKKKINKKSISNIKGYWSLLL